MEKLDPSTHERSDGPTPNGGAYAIAYFRDKDGRPCRKEDSDSMEIVEFSESGEQVFRTYMQKQKPRPIPESDLA